jgi:hypothetical protein
MAHRARLELLVGKREALAISAALRPSNVRLPKGMGIAIRARSDRLIIDISMQDGLYTLLSTLNEVLGEAEAAWGAITASEKARVASPEAPSFK